MVARDGTIDWLCLPRFDSPACLAALLDTEAAGCWRLGPDAPARITRRYRPGTLILETCFETDHGRLILTDFMPPATTPEGSAGPALIRILRAETGAVPCRLELRLRFDYGSFTPWVTRRRTGFGITAVAGPDMVVLHSTQPIRGENFTSQARFTLAAGEEAAFVLIHGPS
ncbi:MAG: trehalase-like domain-containing protein, partial [Acetobacteraceae bacterium]